MRDVMERRGGRPFVFALAAAAQDIITLHDGRQRLNPTKEGEMFKLMLTTAVLIGTTVPTLAETYVYQCCRGGVYPDGPVNARRCHGAGILGTVKVDEDKGTLTWRGTTFTNLKVTTEETLAKYSWRATRDGLYASTRKS